MYTFLKIQYRLKRITAIDVWNHVDNGYITEQQAITICGVRPK